jgi:hypothetical protein
METGDGIIVGRIVAPSIDKFFTAWRYDSPIADVISIASRLATANNVAIGVYDPKNR